MKIIHMEIDQTEHSANQMIRDIVELSDHCDSLSQAQHRLGSNWIGGNAHQFIRDFRNCVSQLENQINDLDNLVFRMKREIQQWKSEDSNGLNRISKSGFNFHNIPSFSDQGNMPWNILMGTVLGGINSLFKVGQGWYEDAQNQIDQIIQDSDQNINDYLLSLFGPVNDGESNTIELSLKDKFSIPGGELGIPGSFVVGQGNDFKIIRNEDGTFSIYLETNSLVGLEHQLLAGAEGNIGKYEGKIGPSAKIEGGISPISYSCYTFDPDTQGDLTKMIALCASIGLSLPSMFGGSIIPNTTVGPTLAFLYENLTEIGVVDQLSVSGELSQNALVKIAGIEGKSSIQSGSSLVKEDGVWKSVSKVELENEAEVKLLIADKNINQQIELQSVTNLETGESSSIVTLTVEAESGSNLSVDDVSKLLPKDAVIEISHNDVQEIKITYQLDQPVDTVKEMFSNPDGFSIDPLLENSSISVSETRGISTEGSIGGKVSAGAGQSIGAKVEGEVKVTNEKTIYSYP